MPSSWFLFSRRTRGKRKEREKYLKLDWEQKTNKLWNMKGTLISLVAGTLRTISKDWERAWSNWRSEEQDYADYRTARILRGVLETWEDLLSFRLWWENCCEKLTSKTTKRNAKEYWFQRPEPIKTTRGSKEQKQLKNKYRKKNNYMDISSDKQVKSPPRNLKHSFRMRNLKRETKSLLKAAENNSKRTNYIKARMDKTQ